MNTSIFRIIYYLILLPMAFIFVLPVVIIIRVLRPFYLVRIGFINNGIFGHFTFEPEYYLSKKIQSKTNSLDLFFFYSIKSVNRQWEKMVKRNIHVFPFVRFIYHVNFLFPGSKHHIVNVVDSGSRDTKNVFHEVNQQIKLLRDEELLAEECLKEFGFKNNNKFVCIVS